MSPEKDQINRTLGTHPNCADPCFFVYSLATRLPLHKVPSDIFLLSLGFNLYRLFRGKKVLIHLESSLGFFFVWKMRMLEKKGKKGEEIYMGGVLWGTKQISECLGMRQHKSNGIRKARRRQKKRLVRHKEIVQISWRKGEIWWELVITSGAERGVGYNGEGEQQDKSGGCCHDSAWVGERMGRRRGPAAEMLRAHCWLKFGEKRGPD